MFDHEQADRDLDAELQAYIELLAAEKVKAGMSPEAARRAAMIESGGVTQVKDQVRDVRAGVWIETVLQDLRYAFRTLRKAPAFSASAGLTLALGLAASTAIFSMVSGVLLRRLPIGSGNRLVHLSQPSVRGDNEGFSVMEVKDLDRDLHAASGVAEYHSMSFQLYGHGDPLRVQTGVVSDKFFDLLGVKPLLGRTFRPGEEAVGAPPVVVLSYRYWMDQFRGDSSIVGATFTMNDRVHTVVGVLPALPGYPNDNDIWMPAGACPFRSAPQMLNVHGHRMVDAFAVLKPSATIQQAQTELASLTARYHAAYPADYPADRAMRFQVTGARDEMTARAKPVLLLLMGTAAFLLLAAVANVANLSLSRQMRRGRELALRVALGAGARRLYRQLAFESVMVAFGAGIVGVALGGSGIGLLRTMATRFTPRAGEIHMDLWMFGFALVLCVVTGLVLAAVPFINAIRTRDVSGALRQGNSSAMRTKGDLRVRSVLVVAQVAIACVMLVGAGLIGRSLIALERVDAGIDVSNVLTARLTLNFTKYNTSEKRRDATQRLLQRLDGLPGVTSMAIASDLPLNNGQPAQLTFRIEGIPSVSGGRGPKSDVTAISPAYFKTVAIPVVRGRGFLDTDRDTANVPVVISQRLAKTFWGSRDPLSTRISADDGKHWNTVVGIVGDVRQNRLDGDVTDEIYFPAITSGNSDMRVFLRATGPVPPLIPELRAAVRDFDPQQPVATIQTLEQVRGAQLAEPRLTTTLLSVFAALALLLTAAGLAGVIAYGVTQRLPEIAIRMALGANAGRVLTLVMGDGLAIVVVGLLVGLGLSAAVGRVASAMLFHVSPSDLATYLAATVLILATAVAACLIPSRRALRADPAQVFRSG